MDTLAHLGICFSSRFHGLKSRAAQSLETTLPVGPRIKYIGVLTSDDRPHWQSILAMDMIELGENVVAVRLGLAFQ